MAPASVSRTVLQSDTKNCYCYMFIQSNNCDFFNERDVILFKDQDFFKNF